MSAQDRKRWGDLEKELVAAERLAKEAAESYERAFGRPEMTETQATESFGRVLQDFAPGPWKKRESDRKAEPEPLRQTDGGLILE
jgi:hypothetical protein